VFPAKSSQTETSASYLNLPQNSANFSISIRISVRHITLRWMEQASELIKCSNNISESSVKHNKTTGMNGSPLHNTQRIRGPPQPQRRHHLTYSLDTPHESTNLPEKPTSPP
jgi:hypothetical protein